MIITIDGPVATGKSTIARALAKKLGFHFFDTGAMYRVLTYACMMTKTSLSDKVALSKLLKDFKLDIRDEATDPRYFWKGQDITKEIRLPEVSQFVSEVAAVAQVREALVPVQRGWAKGVNVVFEGRDLGTVVFPDADLKVFLTGRDDVRAERRLKELEQKFPQKQFTKEEVLRDLLERDRLDSTREHSPLKQPNDALVIDTSDKSINEIVEELVKAKGKKVA